jgi:hypothetical protein
MSALAVILLLFVPGCLLALPLVTSPWQMFDKVALWTMGMSVVLGLSW